MARRHALQESGYITVEYAIVTAVVILVLLAPIPGLPGISVVDIVMDSIREFQSHTASMLALP